MYNFIDAAENLISKIGKIFSWIILVITIMVVIDVILRKFLNSPTNWSFEIVIQLYAIYFLFKFPYALLTKSHVSIDIIYEKLPNKTKFFFDIISFALFFFPFTLVLLLSGIDFAYESWLIREKSWSSFGCPLYIAKTAIPITALLLIIQGIVIILKKSCEFKSELDTKF